jgi:hypothetical protein
MKTGSPPAWRKTMIGTFAKQILSLTLSFLLVVAALPFEAGAQQSAPPSGYSGQGVPLTAEELQQLTGPIALYPDALVAQILGAATFPDQIANAAKWVHESNLTGTPLMQAVDKQTWDPSVKALTQFPSVLDNMAKNLSWTSALGEAYHTQAADVMSAIQFLRAKAKAAGNLKSGSQIVVVQESPQTIVIQSASPQVVYVPVYNPAVVYGVPYVYPTYVYPAPPPSTAVLAFGVGIAVGAMMSNSCCGWGYSSWNCGWHSTTVVYRGGSYYGNSAWHGGVAHYGTSYNPSTGTYARGGTVSNGYGSASAAKSYNPSTGTYARGASASNAYGSAGAAQAYNPRTGASASTVQGSNAYGSYGASTVSKNGNTAYGQHQTTSQGTTGQMHTTNGGSAYGASGKYGNSAAVGQTASGDKYATANGNTYKNTGSGWTGNSNNTPKSGSNYSGQNASANSAAKGWGGQEKSSGSSAFGGAGGGGWESKSASARGSSSTGGGGGWGGHSGGGGRSRR